MGNKYPLVLTVKDPPQKKMIDHISSKESRLAASRATKPNESRRTHGAMGIPSAQAHRRGYAAGDTGGFPSLDLWSMSLSEHPKSVPCHPRHDHSREC